MSLEMAASLRSRHGTFGVSVHDYPVIHIDTGLNPESPKQ